MPSYDNATKAQVLTLKLARFSVDKITSITSIETQTLNKLYQKQFHMVLILVKMRNS